MTAFGEVLRWTALLVLSCVVPFGIFVGRNNNIRAFRREIVRDLERLFSFARLPNGQPLSIPSFELVKYKYDPESDPNRDRSDNPHSVLYYLLPVSIYIVLTALGFRMAFMPEVVPLPNYFAFPISVPTDLGGRRSPVSRRAELYFYRRLYLDDPILDPADFQFRPRADIVLPIGRSYDARRLHNGGNLAEPNPRRTRTACDGHHRVFGRLLSDSVPRRGDRQIPVAAAAARQPR
jgi:hypothetical protein